MLRDELCLAEPYVAFTPIWVSRAYMTLYKRLDSLQKIRQMPQIGWAKSQGRDVGGELMSILSCLEGQKKDDARVAPFLDSI